MEVSNMLDIKWDKVDPKFNFAAMHEDGQVWLYSERPEMVDFGWSVRSSTNSVAFYSIYGEESLKEQVDWKDTLTQRPVKANVTNALDINWDDINPRFKFAAMDSNGTVLAHTERPEIYESKDYFDGWRVPSTPGWCMCHCCYVKASLKEPLDWRETLTERPVKASL